MRHNAKSKEEIAGAEKSLEAFDDFLDAGMKNCKCRKDFRSPDCAYHNAGKIQPLKKKPL